MATTTSAQQEQQKEHNNVFAALLQAKKDMGPVYKNASNPAFRSKYADLANIVETTEEPLQNNGILLSQPLEVTEGKLFVRTILHHVSSNTKTDSLVEVVSKDANDPQKVGGAITYYRRYSLLAILGIAPEDDDGNLASQPALSPSRSKPGSATGASATTPSQAAKPAAASPQKKVYPPLDPATIDTFTTQDGSVLARCEVPNCHSGVQLDRVEVSRGYNEGHIICYTHSKNGNWKVALGLQDPEFPDPATDPNFIDPDSIPEHLGAGRA